MVGVTVLAALFVLVWMMLRFGSFLVWPFADRYMPVKIEADRGDGLADGSPILYRGVRVGRVRGVQRSADDLRVLIDAEVAEDRPPPANVKGIIKVAGLLGSQATVLLELTDGVPQGSLPKNAVIQAKFVGSDLLPPEFSQLAIEARDAVRQFRESNLVEHLDQEVQRVGKAVESVQQLLDDPKMREDLKASLASIRSTTERADRIAGRLEKLSDEASETLTAARGAVGRAESEIVGVSRQVGDRLAQLGKLVDQFQSISGKIDQGNGTAGQLINDPKLYQALVDTAREMRATVTDLRRLVQQWEQEGVPLKFR
jgi:phospholipid/cholesterol/gamma-HCH transport system substrate-binding protein